MLDAGSMEYDAQLAAREDVLTCVMKVLSYCALVLCIRTVLSSCGCLKLAGFGVEVLVSAGCGGLDQANCRAV